MSVSYTKEAIDKIVEATGGYPFFLQQLCQIVYERTNSDVIDGNDVDRCKTEFLKSWMTVSSNRDMNDAPKVIKIHICDGEMRRFAVYYFERCTKYEKSVSSISTIRAQLINKGIIYPVRFKEVDFTVPEFDEYIKRLEEYKQWLECS